MVASASEEASRIGIAVLDAGGNAVDAAVAVAFVLQVTHPTAGNIGGGGFMVVRMANGETAAIDYRETAPAAAHAKLYLDTEGNVIPQASVAGHRAIAVPGTVAGLSLALAKFGTRPWSELVEHAHRLAAEGIVVQRDLVASLWENQAKLAVHPETKRIYLRDGQLWKEGDLFKQPELAATLERLRDQGPRDFYEGQIAAAIIAEIESGRGLITLDDLRTYRAVIRGVLRGSYRGHEVITMPPPSSGGVALIEMLNILENRDLRKDGPGSSATLHWLAEAMRLAFADRAEYLADPDFVIVPVAELTSKEYARRLYGGIDPHKAAISTSLKPGAPTPPPESPDTTHFTIVDAAGNAVANTYTLNLSYGSGVTVAGAGFLLNNEMDDFSAKAGVPNAFGLLQSDKNAIEPGKRPLSSMTPTIVLKDGNLYFAAGSPGGPTIINTVLQIMVNIIDFDMNIQQAIDAPRIHQQWLPDSISYEPYGIVEDVKRALEARGHRFAEPPAYMGDAQGIMLDLRTGQRLGASDSRHAGKALAQ
jgi:gamma-glutamyltranspeptidase/glutathione hydrolase